MQIGLTEIRTNQNGFAQISILQIKTAEIDLIQVYLMKSGFASQNFKRIDGDCPTAKREKILEDFENDNNLRVLIMTTGTGAVG